MTTLQHLPSDTLQIIASFVVKPVYKLRSWLSIEQLHEHSLCKNENAIEWIENNMKTMKSIKKISWFELSQNPNAIHLLEKNIHKVNWFLLSKNPNAISILEKNLEFVDWPMFSLNPNAMPIIEKNQERICNAFLSKNRSAVPFLEKHPERIDWYWLSANPSAIHLLEKHPEKINWRMLSLNPNAIHILERNPQRIDWDSLCANPSAAPILERNVEKINWFTLSRNPGAISLLEKNLDQISWNMFALNTNPAVVSVFEKHQEKIKYSSVYLSQHPSIFELDVKATYKKIVKFAAPFLKKIKIEMIDCIKYDNPPSMNPIQEPLSMNLNQDCFIQPTGESILYAKKCPPPPPARTGPIADWPCPTETTFSWGARPTWDLPPPRSRSGAESPGFKEATHSWSDLALPAESESLRHLTMPIESALLQSRQGEDIIHPDIKHVLIRQRGSYWWEKSQAKLEQQFSSGAREPVQGGFYVFLEEEQSGNIVRFGNVLTGVFWVMQTVVFPKGHPDADVPPYQMIDARE